MPEIALVTSEALPRLTDDDRLLLAPLAERGVRARPVVWSEPHAWRRFAALVLRSPWDYHRRFSQFCRWLDRIERAGARVYNPVPLLRWNLDKSYLLSLQAAGVPIVPTWRVRRGGRCDLVRIADALSVDELVIKPAISAGGRSTYRLQRHELRRANERAARILRRCDLLVQPFLPEVTSHGEWSLHFFAGSYSHAVRKLPKAGEFRVQPEHGGTIVAAHAPEVLIAHAANALGEVPGETLYARIDAVMRGGAPLLMELEIIEPAMHLGQAATAAACFADAIASVARARSS